MCVIVLTEQPATVGHRVIENMAQNNPDGWGCMWYREDHTLEVQRGLYSLDAADAFRAYGGQAVKVKSPFFFHLRKRTEGVVTVDNCHPFPVNKGAYSLMHNGTVDGLRPADHESESDTAFLAHLLGQFDREVGIKLESKATLRLLGLALGGNRAVLAASDKRQYGVINPGLWTHIGAHWVSNLYAWDAYTLTKGRFGSKEMEKKRRERNGQISLFR